MNKLHTFGCSITQGFALPDVVQPELNPVTGLPLTKLEIQARKIHIDWEKIHVYAPSRFAWPQVLADRLGITVENHARRGACFDQIARQCVQAAPHIHSSDTVIVMWTYLSRISLQWPARNAVPFCTVVDSAQSWRSKILPGFNKFFGLSGSTQSTAQTDQRIHQHIYAIAQHHLDPLSLYDRYYRSLVLQVAVDGLLQSTGARVIHLSVEPESYLDQLALARQDLDPQLQPYTRTPHPESWYTLAVDHESCRVIHDPSIPPAENDMHPSVEHHLNFSHHIYHRYFDI